MASFDDIDKARNLLGIGEAVTLKEVRSAYRKLASRYHPDKHKTADSKKYEETMKELNWAYKVITDFCREYKYTFTEKDVARTYPYDEYVRRYHHGWFDGI
jgi:DnaJ-class molecular chaperone